MEPPDEELVRQARAGSGEALGRLLALCSPALEAYLVQRLGARLRRHTSLSDIRQDVLLRGTDALRVLPEHASVDDFQALLLQHARWAIGHAARKEREFAGESAIPGERTPSATPSPTPSEGHVTRQDELARLAEDVEALEEPLAAAMRLRLQGLTFAQIARDLGIGEDAARKRLVRAAMILRRRRTGGGGGLGA